MIPTLIPEASSYGVALLFVYGLGSFGVAGQIIAMVPGAARVRPLAVYCGVLAAVAAWGALVLGVAGLFDASALALLLSLPVGLAIEVAASAWDRGLLRRLHRRRLGTRVRGREQARERLRGISFDPSDYPLWGAIGIAALEELIYRGFFVEACLLLDGGWQALALAGTVIAFALTHLRFGGWAQVAAKLPLGALALAGVLALGTVLPAVVAHVAFNVRIWRDLRRAAG